jgi:WD40 repeat protein
MVLGGFMSGDGQRQRLVAAGARGRLRVYDPESGEALWALDAHTGMVLALACFEPCWAPQHPHVVSASEDSTAKVWDGETGRLVCSIGPGTGAVCCLALYKEHAEGRDCISISCLDALITVWDGETGALVQSLEGHTNRHCLVAYEAPNGTARLVSASHDGTVTVWEPEAERLLHTIDGLPQVVNCLQLLERGDDDDDDDGRYRLAGGDVAGGLWVWDLGPAPARGVPCIRSARRRGG